MIRNSEPLSMSEAEEYLTKNNQEINEFIDKFKKIGAKEAKELKQKLKDLDMVKVKDTHICKVIDIMPKDEEELNMIFSDVSLDSNESQKILDTIKEFK